jgi:hypothetical protein
LELTGHVKQGRETRCRGGEALRGRGCEAIGVPPSSLACRAHRSLHVAVETEWSGGCGRVQALANPLRGTRSRSLFHSAVVDNAMVRGRFRAALGQSGAELLTGLTLKASARPDPPSQEDRGAAGLTDRLASRKLPAAARAQSARRRLRSARAASRVSSGPATGRGARPRRAARHTRCGFVAIGGHVAPHRT